MTDNIKRDAHGIPLTADSRLRGFKCDDRCETCGKFNRGIMLYDTTTYRHTCEECGRIWLVKYGRKIN